MATKCCPTDVKPAINSYKGVGKQVALEGLFNVYVTGDGTADKAIVLVYDVLGHTPNAEQLADALAQHMKCLVAIPDFMRGKAWPASNVPPTKDGAFPDGVEPADGVEVMIDWIMTHPTCQFEPRVDEFRKVKEYLMAENKSLTKLGAVGMCWGGKVCFLAAASNTPNLVDAIATCHGSLITKDDAEAVTVPVCMLNSKDEPESYRTEVKPILDAKPFADLNFYKEFPTMHHGWMGTRGIEADTDFGIAEQREKYAEGVTDLVNFFTAVLA